MQFLVNGLISGSAIAVLAVAFQVVYLPTRVLFIALAGVYALAPFSASVVINLGAGWFAAISIAILLSSLLCVLCELLNHGPLARKQASEGIQLIASLGVYIVIVQTIVVLFGSNIRTLRTGIDGVSAWGDIVVTWSQWITLGTSALLMAGFAAVILYSATGLKLRALAENPIQFELFGYDVARYRLIAFGLSGFLAAASALLTGYESAFDPYVGLQAVLLAVVAVIVGGRNSFVGPVLAALLLGIIRSTVVWNFSARWQEAITFALLALFLLFRPQGLLGQASRIEAAN